LEHSAELWIENARSEGEGWEHWRGGVEKTEENGGFGGKQSDGGFGGKQGGAGASTS